MAGEETKHSPVFKRDGSKIVSDDIYWNALMTAKNGDRHYNPRVSLVVAKFLRADSLVKRLRDKNAPGDAEKLDQAEKIFDGAKQEAQEIYENYIRKLGGALERLFKPETSTEKEAREKWEIENGFY